MKKISVNDCLLLKQENEALQAALDAEKVKVEKLRESWKELYFENKQYARENRLKREFAIPRLSEDGEKKQPPPSSNEAMNKIQEAMNKQQWQDRKDGEKYALSYLSKTSSIDESERGDFVAESNKARLQLDALCKDYFIEKPKGILDFYGDFVHREMERDRIIKKITDDYEDEHFPCTLNQQYKELDGIAKAVRDLLSALEKSSREVAGALCFDPPDYYNGNRVSQICENPKDGYKKWEEIVDLDRLLRGFMPRIKAVERHSHYKEYAAVQKPSLGQPAHPYKNRQMFNLLYLYEICTGSMPPAPASEKQMKRHNNYPAIVFVERGLSFLKITDEIRKNTIISRVTDYREFFRDNPIFYDYTGIKKLSKQAALRKSEKQQGSKDYLLEELFIFRMKHNPLPLLEKRRGRGRPKK